MADLEENEENGKKPGKAPAFSHDDMFSGEPGI